uniref:Uncharacterized protein n=1 Tax=Lepisosteus oculatus TaxID=7918 RepID=W5N419_LEPOC
SIPVSHSSAVSPAEDILRKEMGSYVFKSATMHFTLGAVHVFVHDHNICQLPFI